MKASLRRILMIAAFCIATGLITACSDEKDGSDQQRADVDATVEAFVSGLTLNPPAVISALEPTPYIGGTDQPIVTASPAYSPEPKSFSATSPIPTPAPEPVTDADSAQASTPYIGGTDQPIVTASPAYSPEPESFSATSPIPTPAPEPVTDADSGQASILVPTNTSVRSPTATTGPIPTSTPISQPTSTPIATPAPTYLPVEKFLALPTSYVGNIGPEDWLEQLVEGCLETSRQMDAGGWEEQGTEFASEREGPPDLWGPDTQDLAYTMAQVLRKGSDFCGIQAVFDPLFGDLFPERYQTQKIIAEQYWWQTWSAYAQYASGGLEETYLRSIEGASPGSQRAQFTVFQDNWWLHLSKSAAFQRELSLLPG